MARKDLLSGDLRRTTETIADLVLATVTAEVGQYSDTLAQTFKRSALFATQRGFKFTVESPFFWANIIDKGRPEVVPKNGNFLIWFRNPLEDDPRLQGGYHKTLGEAQSIKLDLSTSEWRDLRKNDKIIVATYSGSVPATNYVQTARRQFKRDAEAIFKQTVRASVLRQIRELSGTFKFQITL